MSIFKRTQRKYVKKAYRVRNWREYEAGLRNRGSLTVWISLTAGKLVNWDAPRPRRRKPGRQRKYSNLRNFDLWDSVLAYQRVDDPRFFQLRSLSSSPGSNRRSPPWPPCHRLPSRAPAIEPNRQGFGPPPDV